MGLNVLLTGVTGYVGSVLAPRLLRDGHSVRGFARDPSRARLEDVPVLAGDAVSGEGLAEALEGIDVAYFLIHPMEPATTARRVEAGRGNVRRFDWTMTAKQMAALYAQL